MRELILLQNRVTMTEWSIMGQFARQKSLAKAQEALVEQGISMRGSSAGQFRFSKQDPGHSLIASAVRCG